MLLWFVVHRRGWACVEIVREPGDPARRQSAATRSRFFVEQRRARLPRARLRSSSRHRRRGALRRHGALRPAPDPRRLVRARLPGAAPQLLRAGRAAARAIPRPPRTRSTRSCPAWALYPMVGARDGRDRHRVAGAHLRRVLAHAAGGAARLLPARHHRAHVGSEAEGRSTSREVNCAADGRAASRWCSASSRRTRSPPPTASPSPARWPSPRSSSTRRRAPALGLVARAGARVRCSCSRRRPRVSSSPTSVRSRRAAGSRWPWPSVLFAMMTTWKRGAEACARMLRETALPLDLFLDDLRRRHAAARDGHRGVHDVGRRAVRRPCCCTTSSTTRCCTSRSCSCRC